MNSAYRCSAITAGTRTGKAATTGMSRQGLRKTVGGDNAGC